MTSKLFTLSAASLLTLTAAPMAQTYFYSPATAATTDGNQSVLATQVFGGASRRYQFILGDVAGTPRPNINAVDWRWDMAHSSAYAARTMTLTAVMSHTSYANRVTTFATNYVGPTTTVINARTFNLPATSGVPTTPAPQPWSINFPFDTGVAFSYDGVQDLLFEVVVDGVTPTGSYSVDTQSNIATSNAGTASYPRAADQCTASGRTVAQDIWYAGGSAIPFANGRITLNQYMDDGPASAAGVLVFGVTDVNTNLGGLLCGFLRPSVDVALPVMTDAAGLVASPTAPLSAVLKHPGVPAQIRSQFGILDTGRAPTELAISLSDSILWNVTLPIEATPRVGYTSTSSTAVTGSLSTLYTPVMRFTY
jgi:hypothetical protein